jgi:hypothetical protein
MIVRERFIKTLAVTGVAAILLLILTGCSKSKDLDAGSTWEVTETTKLTVLTIADGATIKVTEGYSLTMTINAIETSIEPGEYTGDIVLTPTENIPIFYNGSGIERTYNFRTGIYVNNGTYIPEKSVEAAAVGGEVTDNSAKDVRITSVGERFNGIIVTGDSKSSYSIINPVINFTGNGGNDFAGYGAAIMTDGKAEVTVDNARIVNKGCIRGAVWVGGNSIAHINNSYIEVQNGTVPEVFTTAPAFMMEVPWSLGLTGNNRATLVAEYGTAYYNNSHIKAEAWGALSTDAVEDVRLYAVNCNIESGGYGSYADRVSHNEFSGCRFDVADYGLIMGGGDGIFTDGCVVNSDRHGVMIHNCMGTLTIDKGSVFNSNGSVILMKTAYPTIIVDGAELNSESGIIIQAIVNDDPMGRPGAVMPEGFSGGVPGGPGVVVTDTSDITVLLKNTILYGDIVNAMTPKGNEIVSLENTTLTGAITTATSESQADIDGVEVSKETYYYIGEVKNTYCATDDEYGMEVSLDRNSTWIIDETSYLTGLTIAEGCTVTAPEGYKASMTINGSTKAIKAGDYKGKIVITVTKS